MSTNFSHIAEELWKASRQQEQKKVHLFAGAGVSIRAGLPSWQDYLLRLAQFAEAFNKITAESMRQKIKDGHLISAAGDYKRSPYIPAGEKHRGLESCLGESESKKLNALISLPFNGIVTTNFDRALHDSYAEVTAKAPLQVELDDGTLKTANWLQDFFIARIHGRAEYPVNIVLDDNDFKEIKSNNLYVDFLLRVLSNSTCIFIGYSFMDPAISSILELLEEKLAPNFPQLHYAFVPNSSDRTLFNRLAAVNFKMIEYSPDKDHEELWDAIKEVSRKLSGAQKTEKPPSEPTLSTTQKFLAMTYAKGKMHSEKRIEPLRSTISDGIVLDIIAHCGKQGCTKDQVVNELRQHMPLSEAEAKHFIDQRVSFLLHENYCLYVEGKVVASETVLERLAEHDNDMNVLVNGVIDRAFVREGAKISVGKTAVVREALEEVILSRGWDLGAHFSGSTIVRISNLLPTIRKALSKSKIELVSNETDILTHSIFDLLNSPAETESSVLAAFGRISFGLNLVLGNPTQYIAHNVVLPQRIFLDANVLLPAIVRGHPYHQVYKDALQRLRSGAENSGLELEITVNRGFLGEVVSHRRIALQQIRELGLDNPKTLDSYMTYNGAEFANVFVSAYASEVSRLKRQIDYNEFIKSEAPYESVSQLAEYLRNSVFLVTETDSSHKLSNTRILEIISDLEAAYGRQTHVNKNSILIQNEALQLAYLEHDQQQGVRSIFATADNNLREAISHNPGFSEINKAVVNRRGLVLLIDFLLGLDSEPISTARILWGGYAAEETILVRDYLIDQALKHFHHAMSKPMMEVIENMTNEIVLGAKRADIRLQPSSDSREIDKAIKYMDRFEDRFYELMAKAAPSLD
ncbi:MAG: SIR2 family protein [Anaerolineales bacterium]|nr:MAG: SIR2 family protein [Anaerolineales bacterium]